MMKLRYMATALIFNEDKVLLMKRPQNENSIPYKWSLVEGYIEPEELSDPIKACIRVIEQETGLAESDIIDLQLKYIVHTAEENEIKIRYVYSGTTQKSQLVQSEKSELIWIKQRDCRDLKVKYITEIILGHCLNHGSFSDDLHIGVTYDRHHISFLPVRADE